MAPGLGRWKQAHWPDSLTDLLSFRPVRDLVSKGQGGWHPRNDAWPLASTFTPTHARMLTNVRGVGVTEMRLSHRPFLTKGVLANEQSPAEAA